MGLSFSCPGADYDALDETIEAALMVRAISFNGQDTEPAILKTFGSRKMIIEGSVSFKRRELDPCHLEKKMSIKTPSSEQENSVGSVSFKDSRSSHMQKKIPESPMLESGSPKHEAALKLQKVYKSFRTRRQLADCAVLVEQGWWKLLDFALLEQSSVSFFDIEKQESALSRWSRARTRAAKVGKGLSKDDKAQKLALQHWLEAIDPRHRYGHNLHFYYVNWLHCPSRQPFFYWLDVGEGKEVNHEQKCPRSKLQQQCIKYLGPKEREAYEVVVDDGKFFYNQNRQLLDTSEGPKDSKWIFVLSTSKNLYVGQKKKGTFQHSSFLAGGATSSAGRLVVENGILRSVWPHSGHYCPTEENFQEFMSFLKEKNVDLTDVKKSPNEEDDKSCCRLGSISGLRCNSSEQDLTVMEGNINAEHVTEEQTSHASNGTSSTPKLKRSNSFKESKGMRFSSFPAGFELGGDRTVKESFALEQDCMLHKQNMFEDQEEREEESDGETNCSELTKTSNSFKKCEGMYYRSDATSPSGGEEVEESSTSEQHYKQNLFVEKEEEEESVPEELILRRINSKKGMKSYQLGKQLSFKWTTGAGPRIGCVRDYPSELQLRALEQVNLSPRSAGNSTSFASPQNRRSQSSKS